MSLDEIVPAPSRNAMEMPRAAKILVVDDEPIVAEFACEVLAALGYEALRATDGFAAIALIEDYPDIELLFTDIVMPGIDGIVLADMVKRRYPNIRILYASAYRDVSRAMDAAGILHGKILNKPYRPRDLETNVASLLA